MKAFVTSMAAILITILAVSSPLAQQLSASATPVTTPSTAPSPFTIRQHFLSQQAATIQIDIRAAQRCVQNATQTFFDVVGNINRVAQTDLVNCGRRLAQLQEALTKLGRTSAKLAEDAAAEAEIIAGLLKQQQMLQAVSEQLTPTRRFGRR
jgi:hypothetical protein